LSKSLPRTIKAQATTMVNFATETKIIAEKEASPLPSLVATSAADASSKKGQHKSCTSDNVICDNVIERHDDEDADAIHDDHTHSVRFVKTVDVHVHNGVLGFNPSTKTGPPVQLGWKFEEHTADLKCCDGADAGSAGGIVHLSARDRHSMLKKEGFTSEEMTVREESVQQIAKSIASSSSSSVSSNHHPTNPDGSTKKKVRRGTAYVKSTPEQQLVQKNTATNSIRSYAIDDSHKSVRVSELHEQQKKEQPTSASSTQQPSKSASNADVKGALANKNPTSSSESGCCFLFLKAFFF